MNSPTFLKNLSADGKIADKIIIEKATVQTKAPKENNAINIDIIKHYNI